MLTQIIFDVQSKNNSNSADIVFQFRSVNEHKFGHGVVLLKIDQSLWSGK